MEKFNLNDRFEGVVSPSVNTEILIIACRYNAGMHFKL